MPRWSSPLRCHAVALVLFASGCSHDPAPEQDRAALIATVQRDVETMVRALYSGDIDTVLDLTHPAVLSLVGGRDAARAGIEPMLPLMAKMKVESFTFPAPPTFVDTTGASYAIVPTLSIIVMGGQRVESLNYQFGARARGEEAWRYAEGSRVDTRNVRQLFPDFPAEFEFPEINRRKLPD